MNGSKEQERKQNKCGFLSVEESAKLFPSSFITVMASEQNSMCKDITQTLSGLVISLDAKEFIMITGGAETFAVIKNKNDVFMFDSHAHGEHGALVAVSNLDMLCCITEMFLSRFLAEEIFYIVVIATQFEM